MSKKLTVTQLKQLIQLLLKTPPFSGLYWPESAVENLLYQRPVSIPGEITLQLEIQRHAYITATLTIINKKFIYKQCPECKVFKAHYDRYGDKALCKECQKSRVERSNAKHSKQRTYDTKG